MKSITYFLLIFVAVNSFLSLPAMDKFIDKIIVKNDNEEFNILAIQPDIFEDTLDVVPQGNSGILNEIDNFANLHEINDVPVEPENQLSAVNTDQHIESALDKVSLDNRLSIFKSKPVCGLQVILQEQEALVDNPLILTRSALRAMPSPRSQIFGKEHRDGVFEFSGMQECSMHEEQISDSQTFDHQRSDEVPDFESTHEMVPFSYQEITPPKPSGILTNVQDARNPERQRHRVSEDTRARTTSSLAEQNLTGPAIDPAQFLMIPALSNSTLEARKKMCEFLRAHEGNVCSLSYLKGDEYHKACLELLSLFEYYKNPEFRAVVSTFSEYKEFISNLSLRIQQDSAFRTQVNKIKIPGYKDFISYVFIESTRVNSSQKPRQQDLKDKCLLGNHELFSQETLKQANEMMTLSPSELMAYLDDAIFCDKPVIQKLPGKFNLIKFEYAECLFGQALHTMGFQEAGVNIVAKALVEARSITAFAEGSLQGVASGCKSMADIIRHPVETIKGLLQAYFALGAYPSWEETLMGLAACGDADLAFKLAQETELPPHVLYSKMLHEQIDQEICQWMKSFSTAKVEDWAYGVGYALGEFLAFEKLNPMRVAGYINRATGFGAKSKSIITGYANRILKSPARLGLMLEIWEVPAEISAEIVSSVKKGDVATAENKLVKVVEETSIKIIAESEKLLPSFVAKELTSVSKNSIKLGEFIKSTGEILGKYGPPTGEKFSKYFNNLRELGISQSHIQQIAEHAYNLAVRQNFQIHSSFAELGLMVQCPKGIMPEIARLEPNKIHHILQEKHAWGKVVSDPKNWDEIAKIMTKVMDEGVKDIYKEEMLKKTIRFGSEDIEVIYRYEAEQIIVSNGWVANGRIK